MDEGYDTGEKLALKFVCKNFAAKFIYPFSRKREISYDLLRRFSAEPFLLRFYTIILAGKIG